MQSEHTAGQAQLVEGTFVPTKDHCSTAVVPAGIFGDGEQPSAVTGNYERLAERNSPTHRVQTDRRTVLAFTEQLKLITYLLGVHEAAMREGEMMSQT